MTESILHPCALYIAFDLGSTKWTLAMSDGVRRNPRCRDIPAGDLERLHEEVLKAKRAFRLSVEAPVRTCFEAGRDGFWLHRELLSRGFDNVVVDPGSMAQPRKRRAKTDRIDARAMLENLILHHEGRRATWSTVHVPDAEVEDERRLERERERLTKERTALRNQIFSVLANCGVPRPKQPPRELDAVINYVGQPLLAGARQQLELLNERLAVVERQLAVLQQVRDKKLVEPRGRIAEAAGTLVRLRGIGNLSASSLSLEGLGWRDFKNTKQAGASTGLVPTPHISDQGSKDLGVSKAARPKLRSLLVQLAWLWLRYQPDSALTKWFMERFGQGKRSRRIGIVALARKLYIALWKYVRWGEVPEGAVLSA